LSAHFDPDQDTPQNTEIRRLGRTLEELARTMGAIALTITTDGTPQGERGGEDACLLESFDWELRLGAGRDRILQAPPAQDSPRVS